VQIWTGKREALLSYSCLSRSRAELQSGWCGSVS